MEQIGAARYPTKAGLRLPVALSRLRDEGLVVCVVAVYAAVLCSRLATHLQQDGWLMLVAGRNVIGNGIPSHDHLAYWTAGSAWIDQQWLAQALFYGIAAAGGVTFALFVHAALLMATFILAVALARMQGASARATAWIAVPAVIPIVSGSWQLRAQTLALFFFVLLLWLLVTDRQRLSRRVYLVLPLLACWANVHGSVLVAVALVIVYALICRNLGWRAALLALGAAAAPFVTPYGAAMLDYYRGTVLNPAFSSFVTEWQPTTLRLPTAPIYLLLLGGIWLIASRGGRMPVFHKVAFLLTAALALLALRNLAFFGLAALVVLPVALNDALPRRAASRRLDTLSAFTALALVLVSAPLGWRSASTGVEERFPPAAATALANAASDDPSLRVFSDVKFADWLLWEHPELEGRVAYDARFELLSYPQLRSIYYWTNQQTSAWETAARGARVVVLDPEATALNEKPLLAERGAHSLYRDGEISVLERPAAPGRP